MRYKLIIAFLALAFAILMIEKSKQNASDNCQKLVSTMKQQDLPLSTSQLVIVKSKDGFKAEMSTCQREGKVWQDTMPPFPVVIGKAGVASLGEKKEGDMKTPAGFYSLGPAFGSQPLALEMDYKYITAEDKFVDDVNSKSYNTWVNGKTDAKSYEPMLIDEYKMGLVINYNTDPVIPGAGSAIFMHLLASSNKGTHGCVAIDKRHLSTLLHWLDKKQQPYIYID
ncbi:L,D-transpeptidase family protein [Legionella sp. 29fVS95]|uniref:L,D-transpeptidase family protein n=1 Tax=Legionella sp. 29fVS95 TaxID=3402813 RepID=UPI003AF9DD3C